MKLEVFVIFNFLKQRAPSRSKKTKMSLNVFTGRKHHKGRILTPAPMAAPTELAGRVPQLHLPSKRVNFHNAF